MANTFQACAVEGCNRNCKDPGSGRGWCPKHYLRFQRHGDPMVTKYNRDQTGKKCSVKECERKAGYKSFCVNHYNKWKKYGDPIGGDPNYHRVKRWLAQNSIYSGDDCIKWPFSVGDNGRGMATINGAHMTAPRAMCTIAHGPPPTKSHHAAHSCGKGHEGCVSPMHLSWKTASENEADKLIHGTLRRGTQINTSKLSEEDVLKIRRLDGKRSRVSLANEFNVTTAAISSIIKRRSWAWLV